MNSNLADVIVVGAGVIGCSIAYNLSRRGASVILLEQDAVGSGASAHATGFNSILGTEFDPGPSFEMALQSYRMFPKLIAELEEETGINTAFQSCPALRLALEQSEVELIKSLMAWQGKIVPIEWLSTNEVLKLEPRLSTTVLGAAYEPISSQLDSYKFTLALAAGAELHGTRVVLREVKGLVTRGDQVQGVNTDQGKILAGNTILSPGAWSFNFSKWLDWPIPVRPLKGERLLLKFLGRPLDIFISSPGRGHMISLENNIISVGSTGGRDYDNQESFMGIDFDRVPTAEAKLDLLQRAIDVFPGLDDALVIDHLSGSRPLSADRLPIIGPVPGWQNVFLATGHGTKGIHLAPITGLVTSNLIMDGDTNVGIDMSTFSAARFVGQTYLNFNDARLRLEE